MSAASSEVDLVCEGASPWSLCHWLERRGNNLTYMDPPALSRGSREEKHVEEQMQSYIRPLCEGILNLRALMKSALPLLNNASALKTVSSFRVWGSRSALSCHHLDHTSHRAVGFLNYSAPTPYVLLVSPVSMTPWRLLTL